MRRAALLVIFLTVALPAVAQPVAESLLKTCIECHGANGVASRPEVPHMDGQKPVYLADSLRSFADRSRPTAVSQHAGLSGDQITALASHYASLAVTHGRQPADAALAAKGEVVYNNRCAECHYDVGRDADKDVPLLAAQNLEYLIAQTLAFSKGVRPFPTMMDKAYRGLSEADLIAVAHFFAAQEPVAPPAGKRRRGR